MAPLHPIAILIFVTYNRIDYKVKTAKGDICPMRLKTVAKLSLGVAVIGGLGWGWYSNQQATHNQPFQKVTIVGSTALQPLTEAAVPGFLKQAPSSHVTVQGGGSGTGLSQVADGAVNIGSSDVYAEQKSGINANQLNDHVVAVAGMVPIVNPKLKIDNLTMEQLRQILSGKITNWQELGGPDLPITVINRASGSGTRLAMEEVVMQGHPTMKAQEQDSNGTVKQIVANVPGSISYIAMPYLNDQVKALKLDGITPSYQNITTNQWKLWSYEHMYTNKKTDNDSSEKFIKYLQSKPTQTQLVKKAGYVAIHDMQVQRDAKGHVTPVKEP